MLQGLDRGLPPVATWQQLYNRLGRGYGWAYFTPNSANELVPHWFGNVEYKCQKNIVGGHRIGPFIDLEAFGDGVARLESVDETVGPDAENYGETKRVFDQFGDNFIITRKSVFIVE
jgi:hypothetical protein